MNRLQEYCLVPHGINSKSTINLVCDIHGLYTTMAQSHYSKGNGCPLCRSTLPSGYWNIKENVLNSAKNFNSINLWQRKFGGAYNAAKRNNWFHECTAHMIKKRIGYWTLIKCKEDAKKYKTKNEWRKYSSAAYNIAWNKGWIEKCCKHMIELRKFNGYWTKEKCKKDALKYKTRTEWSEKSSGSYCAAKKRNWFNECCKHMKRPKIWNKIWIKNKCVKDASKYRTKTEWRKLSGGAYSAAHKNGWIKECCKHMK